eukprot:SAG11_NODE_93_length_17080_cov_10.504093_3_plen_121_part_00
MLSSWQEEVRTRWLQEVGLSMRQVTVPNSRWLDNTFETHVPRSGKKVFECFFATADSPFKWENVAKKRAEPENASQMRPRQRSFQERKDDLKDKQQQLHQQQDSVIAALRTRFGDPKVTR